MEGISPSYALTNEPERFKVGLNGSKIEVEEISGSEWIGNPGSMSNVRGLRLNLGIDKTINPGDEIIVEYTLKVPTNAARPPKLESGQTENKPEDIKSTKNNLIFKYSWGDGKISGAETAAVETYTKAMNKSEINGSIYLSTDGLITENIPQENYISGIKLKLFKESETLNEENIKIYEDTNKEITSEIGKEDSRENFGFKELDYGRYKIKLDLSPEQVSKYNLEGILDADGFIKYKNESSVIEVTDIDGKEPIINDFDIPVKPITNLSIDLKSFRNKMPLNVIPNIDHSKYIEKVTLNKIEDGDTKTPVQEIELKDLSEEAKKAGKLNFDIVKNIGSEQNYSLEIKFIKNDMFKLRDITNPESNANKLSFSLKPADIKNISIEYVDYTDPKVEFTKEKDPESINYNSIQYEVKDEGIGLFNVKHRVSYGLNEGEYTTTYPVTGEGDGKFDVETGLYDLTTDINKIINDNKEYNKFKITVEAMDLAGNKTVKDEVLDIIRPNKINVINKNYNLTEAEDLEAIKAAIKSDITVKDGYSKEDIIITWNGFDTIDSSTLENRIYNIEISDGSEVADYLKAEPVTVKVKLVPSISLSENEFTVNNSDINLLKSQIESKISRFPENLNYTIVYETGLEDYIGLPLNDREVRQFNSNKITFKEVTEDGSDSEKSIDFKVTVEGSTAGENAIEANNIKVKEGASLSRLQFANAIELKIKQNGGYITPEISKMILKAVTDGTIGDLKPAGDLSFSANEDINVSYEDLAHLSKNITVSIEPLAKYKNYTLEAKNKTVAAGEYTKEQIMNIIELKLKNGTEVITDYNLDHMKFYQGTELVSDFETLLKTAGVKTLQISFEEENAKGIVTEVKITVKDNTDISTRIEATDVIVTLGNSIETLSSLLDKTNLEYFVGSTSQGKITDISKIAFYDNKVKMTDEDVKAIFEVTQNEKVLDIYYATDDQVLKDSFKVTVEGSSVGENAIEANNIKVKEGASLSRLQFSNAIGLKVKKDGNYIALEIEKMILKAVTDGTIGNLKPDGDLSFNVDEDINVSYEDLAHLSKDVTVSIEPVGKYKDYSLTAKDKTVYVGEYSKEDLARIIELKVLRNTEEANYSLGDMKFYEGTKLVEDFKTLLATEGTKTLEVSYEPEGVKGIVTQVEINVLENRDTEEPGDPEGAKDNRLEAQALVANAGDIKTKADLMDRLGLELYLDNTKVEGLEVDKVRFYMGVEKLTDEKGEAEGSKSNLESYFEGIRPKKNLFIVYDYDNGISIVTLSKNVDVTVVKENMITELYAESFKLIKSDYSDTNKFDFNRFVELSKLRMTVDNKAYDLEEAELSFNINFVGELEAARQLLEDVKTLAASIRALNAELDEADRLVVKTDDEIEGLTVSQLTTEKEALEGKKTSQGNKLKTKLIGEVKALSLELRELDSGAEIKTDVEIDGLSLGDLRSEKARLKDLIEAIPEDIVEEDGEEEIVDEEIIEGTDTTEAIAEEADTTEAIAEETDTTEALPEETDTAPALPEDEADTTAYMARQAVTIARLGHPINMLVSMVDMEATDFRQISDLQKLRPGRYDLIIKHKDFGREHIISVDIYQDGTIVPVPEDGNRYYIEIQDLSFETGSASLSNLINIYLTDESGQKTGPRISWLDLESDMEKELSIDFDGENFTSLGDFTTRLNQLAPNNYKANIKLELENDHGLRVGYKNAEFNIYVSAKTTNPTTPTNPGTGGGSGGGGGGGSTGGRDTNPRETTSGNVRRDNQVLEPQIVQYELNKTDHIAYLTGYSDGTVRPEGNLTREEAAMVFYRLLDPEFKAGVDTKEHSFKDIEAGKWSEQAIATLAKAGMITGYADGSFKPNRQLTRAELATMLTKLTDVRAIDTKFIDTVNHWAEHNINTAQANGWIKGYSDGSFRPNNMVKRSEFASMVNNYLERSILKENILPGISIFKDLDENKWYYETMVEATNGHKYEMKNGLEIWTELSKD